jgi:biotin carboxyl carrier protein
MKMQNIITATHRGRISRLCVKTGQIVGKDEILAEIKL